MIIKDWWYAYKVCKKYGIKLKFTANGKAYAYASFNPDTGFKLICVDLRDPDFKQTFLHELSHILSFTRKTKRDVCLHLWLANLNNKMREETQAWVFGKRVMKSQFKSSLALSCLKSYSANHYRWKLTHNDTQKYTDNLVNCFKRIEK